MYTSDIFFINLTTLNTSSHILFFGAINLIHIPYFLYKVIVRKTIY